MRATHSMKKLGKKFSFLHFSLVLLITIPVFEWNEFSDWSSVHLLHRTHLHIDVDFSWSCLPFDLKTQAIHNLFPLCLCSFNRSNDVVGVFASFSPALHFHKKSKQNWNVKEIHSFLVFFRRKNGETRVFYLEKRTKILKFNYLGIDLVHRIAASFKFVAQFCPFFVLSISEHRGQVSYHWDLIQRSKFTIFFIDSIDIFYFFLRFGSIRKLTQTLQHKV